LPSLYLALGSITWRGRQRRTVAVILFVTAILAAPFPVRYDSFPGIATWLRSGAPTLLISSKLFCVGALWGIFVRDLWSLGTTDRARFAPPEPAHA